ncbi:hypothetical protein M3Y96_01168200 [Aphelenchoides besseyi]|nr:hypothetical protein M3Y96_01168200 [Aphelenchoides besseyi]
MRSKSLIELTFFSVLLSVAVSKVFSACLLFNETVIVRIIKECNGITYTLTSQEKHFELTILAGDTVEEYSQWLVIGGCEFSFRHADLVLLYSAEKDNDSIQYLSTVKKQLNLTVSEIGLRVGSSENPSTSFLCRDSQPPFFEESNGEFRMRIWQTGYNHDAEVRFSSHVKVKPFDFVDLNDFDSWTHKQVIGLSLFLFLILCAFGIFFIVLFVINRHKDRNAEAQQSTENATVIQSSSSHKLVKSFQLVSTAQVKSPSEHLMTRRRSVPQRTSQLTVSNRTADVRVADANLVRLDRIGDSSVQIHGY